MYSSPTGVPATSSRRWISHALLSLGVLLLLFASVPPLVRMWSSPRLLPGPKTLDDYTFVGDDYPAYYPLDLGEVSFTPEDTVHYQIFTADAEREWNSVVPKGDALVLGRREPRLFGLALFHQMHCLVSIRRAVVRKSPTGHAHHCINYLRQAILCEADATLEPVVPSLGRRAVNSETPRVCKDWTKAYELAAEKAERCFPVAIYRSVGSVRSCVAHIEARRQMT